MKILYYLFFIIALSNFTFGQDQSKMILQNQYKGGVCSVGIPVSQAVYSNYNASIPYFIETGSIIKNVYAITTIINNLDTLSLKIKINNTIYQLEQNDITTPFYYLQNGTVPQKIHTSIINCTDAFNNSTNLINLEIFAQGFGYPTYSKIYFIIEYSNPSLPLINYAVYINEENIKPTLNYTLNNHNKIDTTEETCLGLINGSLCGNWDGYNININNTFIGYIHSNDQIVSSFCTGTSAQFYYQNNTVYGLDDDTPDFLMDSSDVLANIQPYLNNPNSFFLQYDFPLSNSTNYSTNAPIAMILAYTPTCNATNINMAFTDTTICKGESVMLQGNGGVTYKWEPGTYLSDNTIANPICTAQQPIWYTCTITNADTCSKTIPVFVDVNTPPTLTATTTADTCGYNTGTILVQANGVLPLSFGINNGNFQAESLFTNLVGGNYNLTVTDANNCNATQTVVVENTNITHAQFTANPTIGTVPTEVEFTNQSTDATDAVWYILEDTFYTQNGNFTFTDTGLYNITLIAYNNTPNCADTTYGKITIVPPLYINIPNVITPNNDNLNDIFSIDVEGAIAVSCKIYNRWGNEVYNFEQPISPNLQTLNIWDAVTTDNSIYSDGTYFYVIFIVSPTGIKESYSGTVQVFGE